MSTYRYERYLSHVSSIPWAIDPTKLRTLWDIARARAAGLRLTDEEISARLAAEDDGRRQAPPPKTEGSVAVIPIVGVVAHRADSFDASSGGTSTQRIGAYLRRAVSDETVKAIVYDFATPGGSVEGVPELAAEMFAARKAKPTFAAINADACSAGFWLATQAHEISITPSGRVGSLGVYMVMIDESEWLAKEGVKVNAISAGEFKLEGAPWQELSDESREHFQTQVNDVYRDFLAAVARGRGRTVAEVKETFGQGRAYDAKEALSRGMVDRIETFEQTLARVLKMKPVPTTGTRAVSDPSGERQPVAVAAADADDLEAQRIADIDAAAAALRLAESR